MSVGLATPCSPEEAEAVIGTWKGAAEALGLPSRPEKPVLLSDRPDRPQPLRDVDVGGGMTVTVGRIRADNLLDLRLTASGSNTIRGAAGGSILNAELLVERGVITPPVIVAKFGGTSVGDAAAIIRSADIIAGRRSRKPVVVVSALGGATNALLAIAEQASKGQLIGALRGTQALRERHLRECDALLTGSVAADVGAEISAMFDELASLAEALSTLGHATPRSMDTIAAFGELISSMLVTEVFRARGIDAVHVDARTIIVTDDQFMQAEPRPRRDRGSRT